MPNGNANGLPYLLARNSGFNPASLFGGGAVVGGFYDGAKWQSATAPVGLWQNSARTTPVTALGQPVGAIDDTSGNNRHLLQATAAARGTFSGTASTFGSELVTNGDFAADVTWAKGAGWTIASGLGTATAATSDISETVSLTAGTEYQLTYTVSGFTAGTVRPKLTGGTTSQGTSRAANGTYTEFLRAESGNTTLTFTATGATLSIDNVSLKAVTAYAAPYGIRMDGVDDVYSESGTHTLSLPCYVLANYSKNVEDSIGFFGSKLDASNNFQIQNVPSTSRGASALRSTARGNATATSGNTQWAPLTPAVIDALSITGTTDVKINNNAAASTANTWIGGDSVLLAKIGIIGTGGTADAGVFFGGMVLLADPGTTGRANCKTYFGRIIGLTL